MLVLVSIDGGSSITTTAAFSPGAVEATQSRLFGRAVVVHNKSNTDAATKLGFRQCKQQEIKNFRSLLIRLQSTVEQTSPPIDDAGEAGIDTSDNDDDNISAWIPIASKHAPQLAA